MIWAVVIAAVWLSANGLVALVLSWPKHRHARAQPRARSPLILLPDVNRRTAPNETKRWGGAHERKFDGPKDIAG